MTQLTSRTWIAIALGLCVLGAACGGRNHEFEQPLSLLDTPLALDDQLVLVDTAGHRAFMLGVTGTHPDATPREVPLPRAPSAIFRRNGENEALILCAGQRASSSEDAEPAVLVALTSSGKTRNYTLGNPFETLIQSEDGHYAILLKSGGAARLLENPNEVAILDLTKDPAKDKAGAIKLRTLRSFGDSPLAVVFSPNMTILGTERRLAVVLSAANVTLIDLSHLDRQETTVQLSAAGGQPVAPTQVVFNGQNAEIYVRGAGSSDVFVFTLTERPGGIQSPGEKEPHNDFRPSIDQLGVGGRPSDMALYGSDANARLLVLASDTQRAALVDVATSQVTNVQLPTAATQVLLFEAASPRDDQPAERALLYEPNASSLTFLDLADLEQRGTRNLEQVSLDRPIAKLIPILQEHQVLIIHDSGGVSLVDLVGRTVSPIKTPPNVKLQDALFDEQRHKLWVGPSGQPFVGLLDLQTGDTPEVLLDSDVQALVPLFSRGKVVAVHQSAIGYLTVLDAASPKRETAKSVRGFLVAGLLDRGQ
jgi:hypothetical protein